MKYSPRGVAPPVILWLFIVIFIAKLLSDWKWTLEEKIAVGLLSFAVVVMLILLLIGLTVRLHGVLKKSRK